MNGSRQAKAVKVEFESDEDLLFSLATNLRIDYDEEQYYISFYQVKPVSGESDQLPDAIKAKLVTGIAVPASKLEAMVNVMVAKMAKRQGELDAIASGEESPANDYNLPEFLSEDELDEFLVRNGVIDKVLSQLEQTPPSKNWEAELDEL